MVHWYISLQFSRKFVDFRLVSARFSFCSVSSLFLLHSVFFVQSEHIPDEDELEAWESKIEASDTWLDKGINRAISNLFGGGKGDNTSG